MQNFNFKSSFCEKLQSFVRSGNEGTTHFRFDSLSLVSRQSVLTLLLLLTLGVGQMWATDWSIAGTMNSWNANTNKRTGTGNISITLSAGSYTFKIVKDGTTWYGNNGTMTRANCSNWGFSTSGENCTITIDKDGTYLFNISNGTPTLSVTYPDPVYYVAGGMNSWSTSADPFVDGIVSFDLTNGTTTEFKIYKDAGNVYYGNNGTMTSANCSNWDFTSGANNAKITANITGTYIFELVNNTPRITVHYPVAISYNKGTNGTGTISGGVKTWGVNYTLSSSTFTRTGYDQDGWATSDGGDKAYNLGGTYSTHTAQTFYPHWTEKTYSLTFSHNGHGTIAVGGVTVSSGSTASVNHVTTKTLVATPSTGYNFTGWTKSGSNTGSVTIGNASNASTTIKATNTGATVTAGFTAKTTTVTLNNQSATTAGTTSVTATYDAAVPTITPPTKTGYTFGGYYTSTGGSGTKYINADGTSAKTWNIADATKTLYAKWTEITHEVRVNTNTHATTSPNSWTAFGEVTGGTVSATSISTGYRFNGWSSDKGGTFADASSASTTFYPTTNDTWVTASIVAKTYSVTLDKNGGDSNGSATATYASSTISSFTGASRAGYSTDGYYTDPSAGVKILNSDGTLVTYSASVSSYINTSDQWKYDNNITLYPHWEVNATYYTLHYTHGTGFSTYFSSISATKTSGGDAIADNASLVSGTGVTITATLADHYRFVGWYSAAGCAANTLVSTDNPYSFSMSDNTSLYAKAELMTTVITLNANGGAGGTSSVTATHGSRDLSSAITKPTRTGYDLQGWYTAESGGTKVITSAGYTADAVSGYTVTGGYWTYTGSTLTLYAHWTAKNYTVTLDKQSGSGGPANVSATYNAAMPSTTMPTRTGYDFQGYYGSTGGSGTKYYNADGSSAHVWDQAAARTIYAHWTAHNYDITYSPASAPTGCTYTTKPTSANYNSTVDMVITPASGYTVSVSAVDASSNPVTVTAGASNHYTFTQPASAVTVTVTATETMRTITINGGTAASTTAGVATTGSATAATPAAGKKFIGWTLGSGVTLSGGALTDRTINFTATANSSVTANYADRAQVKMYFAKPTSLDWGTLYAYAWKSAGGVDPNASYPGVELSTTETINCVVYYVYQYYTEADGIGGAATGNAGWDKIIFGCNNNAKKTGDLNIADGHYYYRATAANTSGKSSAITSAWYIKGTMNEWGETHPITHDCVNNKGTVSINLTGGNNYEFKVYNEVNNQMWSNSMACGSSNPISASMASTQTLYNNDENVMQVNTALTGDYIFEVSSTNASNPKVKVTFPEIYAIAGSFNSWSTSANPLVMDGNTGTVSIALAPNDYTFKVVDDGSMYGKNSTTVTGTTTINDVVIGGNDMTLKADIYASSNPSYTFSYNKSGKDLTITYPSGHVVNYGVGDHAGTASVTMSPNIDSGKKILDSQSLTFSKGSTATGYTWKGWYSNADGTGTLHSSTDGDYTKSSRSGDFSVYACYNLVNYTITYNLNGGSNPGGAPTGFTIESSAVTLPTPTKTGYTFSGWYANSDLSTGGVKTTIAAGSTGNKTYWAKWTAKTYDVILDVNGGSGANQTVTATYDADMPTKLKGSSSSIAARTRTGYNFGGYTANNDGTGTSYYTSALASNHIWDIDQNNRHIYAKWTPKQSALTLDKQTSATGYGSAGTATASAAATYGSAMPALTGTMPTAANGYAFMGFYDATGGGGTKYYNADGTSAATWDKDTESGTTLFAYYKKAEITAITFDNAVVESKGDVSFAVTVSPTPVGDTKLCFTVLHSNDNPLDVQPEITYNGGTGKYSFKAPEASGTYKIEAVLRTGTSCDGGTELDTEVANFQVAGIHTVTVQFKCGDEVIKAATTITGRPLDWSDEMTAPEIFGYTFSNWTAGDGVTISTDGTSAIEGSTTTTPNIYIQAIYDGSLTANYTQNAIIYFKNTLGWDNVFVNFHTGNAWNNTDNGSGYPKGVGNSGLTNRNKHMIQIGESDIYYYDYGAESISPKLYISFTNKSRDGVAEFWAENPGIDVVYPANYPDAISTDRSSENGFKAATPMFVPLESQEAILINVGGGGKANYYNAGYWTKYTPGTGYTLEIYNTEGNSLLKSVEFTSEDDLMPMKATVDLEGGVTYKFQLRRGGTSDDGIYYGNSGTMTYANHGSPTPWDMTNSSFSMCGITTNAAGDYTFNLSYSGHAAVNPHYRLRMAVDYPIASGDYRLVYSDEARTTMVESIKKYIGHPSAIIPKVNNGTDIVSFFVRHNQTPVIHIQQATVDPSTGDVSWNEYPNPATGTNQISGDIASAISAGGTKVYNFNLSMDENGALSVASVEAYTGNYYIRTDAANSKWDNYRSDPDHLMTYSEYSIEHGGYSHYYCHWVKKDDSRNNIKFCIANDYSPCISDTLTREDNTVSGWENINKYVDNGGYLQRDANVRFMWNQSTNIISRAYVDGAQEDGSQFLVISSTDGKIKKEDGSDLTDNKVTFKDNENWIYEANVQAQPTSQFKLISTWGETDVITQYFKGGSGVDETETLIDGSGTEWYNIRLLYDFKTNRLVAAWVPSNANIIVDNPINADVMFIREHQGDIAQLTFGVNGKISKIETAYGVIRFNKWTLANKDKSTHSPLASLASIYERSLFWISFPFRVKLSEVFGFGTYGEHWAIQRYAGDERAAKGHFLENGSFWRWMNRNTEYLEPNQGYLLAIDLDLLGESSKVWGPESRSEQIELYFPSYGTMPDITNASVTQTVPSHECTINRAATEGLPDTGNPKTSYNRTIFDSHWNVLSVPTYVNTTSVTFANTDWKTAIGPKFLYTWNADDNTITATTASGYTYHAMHAYMAQYADGITWTASSGSPASGIVARRTYAEQPKEVEFRLELQQNEKKIDQTFVVLSNDEEVSTNFQFGEDMTKEFNANKASIYSFIPNVAAVAGNTLPMSEQTTIVPIGIDIKKAGNYTISIPDGTSGVGVTLVDTETGERTSLSALDYTVELAAGTYDERFVLEISPVKQTPTSAEEVTSDRLQVTGARKVMIDGLMYIVKDGKMFDARGSRVE